MVKTVIRVTCGGCGIKYTDAKGNARHALKTPESGPFECEIEQAKRLVELGVAEYVTEAVQPAAQQAATVDPPAQQAATVEPEKRLDAAQLEAKTIDQLKTLAADMGVDVSKCKKKAEYIAAIVAAEVETDDDEDDDPDNNLPDLTAANPV